MSGESDYLGEGSRLGEGPSQLLASVAFGAELESYSDLWPWLTVADLAHVRALMKAGVIEPDLGERILRGVQAAHSDEPPPLDPSLGDLYNNRDVRLRAEMGELADWIHTGRARREAVTLAWHLDTREALEEAGRGLAGLVAALVDLADAHRATSMPDFTYLQHAHPTTLAHYVLGFAFPLVRDINRLGEAAKTINRCPAGSGSVNGSRFDIDREALAADLEFDGVLVHDRDAMWAPDLAIGTLSAVTSAFVTIDRLAEELQLWATEEFAFFSPADRHARTSVIMPQKKNPYGLAMVRGHARDQMGRLVSVIATNLTVTGQPDNRVTAYGQVPKSLRLLSDTARLMAEMVSNGDFDTVRMAAAAGSGFTTATELCDWLTAERGFSNRRAHRIVGAAVRLADDDGSRTIRRTDLDEACRELGLEPVEIADEELDRLQKPDETISARRGRGSVADVGPMISELRVELEGLPEPRFGGFARRYTDRVGNELDERKPS